MANITPQQVRDALNTYYSESELQTLAFTLNISFEDAGQKRRRAGLAPPGANRGAGPHGAERAREWAEADANLLAKAYRFDQHDMTTWPACGQLLPHVIAAVHLAREWEVNTNNAAFLNNEAGFYLQHYGSLAEARPFYEQALAIRQQVLGPDHPDTASSLNNLGALLRAMGQLAEARPFYEQALAICEKALGPNHPTTKIVRGNLNSLNSQS